jgi:hypothetical protein
MLFRTALLLAALLPAAVAAQERSGTLMDLLSRVPTDLLEGGADPALQTLHFADVAAATEAVAALPPSYETGLFGPYARLQSPLFTDTLLVGVHGGWVYQVGFAALDIEASLAIQAEPDLAMILRLSPDVAPAVTPALRASGYAEATHDGTTALARGEDFGLEFATGGSEGDPFGDVMGRASRVSLDGPVLLQSNNWPRLLSLAGDDPKGHPDLAPLAAALDDPLWGDARLLEAELWGDPLAFAPWGEGALPAWGTALVADLAEGADTLTLALFTYRTREDAEAAARTLGAGWALRPAAQGQTLQGITGAAPDTRVLGDGPFVTALALRSPTETPSGGFPVNRAFYRLLIAQGRGDLFLFGSL